MAVRRGINHTQGKKKNLTYIKEIIYQYAPISRAEIADMLTLTPATITNNVTLLLETGLIHEIQPEEISEESSVGRRPIMLEFVADAKYVVGVEISPRGIFLAISNICADIIYESQIKGNCLDYGQTIHDVALFIETEITKAGISHNKIAGVGVSAPGFMDRDTGFIRYGIWPEWENKNLAKDLSELINDFLENHIVYRDS